MQQQIRGWRFAAERTQRRRPTREVPLSRSAQLMAGTALMGCRMLGRMAVQAKARSRAGVPAVGGAHIKRAAGGLGLLMATIGVIRWMASQPQMTRDRAPRNRWIMVTVNCSPQRLGARSDLPAPITRLGDTVDIKICPAPGDRGTELGARLRDLPRPKISGMVNRRPKEDPRHMVERALREAKAMIEAGEVLRPDWQPSAGPAQAGDLLELAGRRGGRL
jgi:hypothetical protein